MLYVNDELVKPGSAAYKRFKYFKDNVLNTLEDPVIFKHNKPIRFNETGLPEPLPSQNIPYDHTVIGEEGDEHWVYCDRPPRRNRDGELKYSPHHRRIRNNWRFSKRKDVEQIFFFHEISPFVKKGIIYLQDKRREAQKLISKEVGELDVKFMILSEHSPISVENTGSEDALRMAASAWGIAEAHTSRQSIEEIKVDLLSVVQKSQENYSATQRGYKEFLQEIDSREKMELKSDIQRAVDQGIISFDQPTFTWRFTSNNQPLMTVSAQEATDPKRALNIFLSLNSKSAAVLGYALGKVPTEIPEPEDVELPENNLYTRQQLKDMTDFAQMKSIASKMGINTFKVKKPDLIEMILKEQG